MSDTNTPTPERTVTEKFWVTLNGVKVQVGISSTTGSLCAYQYIDAQGNAASLGRFPTAKYGSQWKALEIISPVLAAYVRADEQSETPKLSTKATRRGVMDVGTVELQGVSPVVAALMATKNISEKEASRIARESGLIK